MSKLLGWALHLQSYIFVTTFPSLSLPHAYYRLPSLIPFTFPFSSATSPSLSLSHFFSVITCRRGSPSSLSRTLTHYAYLLISLYPILCTNTKLLRLKPLTTDSFTCEPSDPRADCPTSPETLQPRLTPWFCPCEARQEGQPLRTHIFFESSTNRDPTSTTPSAWA